MTTANTENPATNPYPVAGTYDVPDLAGLLKCSTRNVRNLVGNGEIPGVIRVGRLVRFHRATVNAWLDAKAKGADRG